MLLAGHVVFRELLTRPNDEQVDQPLFDTGDGFGVAFDAAVTGRRRRHRPQGVARPPLFLVLAVVVVVHVGQTDGAHPALQRSLGRPVLLFLVHVLFLAFVQLLDVAVGSQLRLRTAGDGQDDVLFVGQESDAFLGMTHRPVRSIAGVGRRRREQVERLGLFTARLRHAQELAFVSRAAVVAGRDATGRADRLEAALGAAAAATGVVGELAQRPAAALRHALAVTVLAAVSVLDVLARLGDDLHLTGVGAAAQQATPAEAVVARPVGAQRPQRLAGAGASVHLSTPRKPIRQMSSSIGQSACFLSLANSGKKPLQSSFEKKKNTLSIWQLEITLRRPGERALSNYAEPSMAVSAEAQRPP